VAAVGFIGFKDGGADLGIAATTDGIGSSTELLADRTEEEEEHFFFSSLAKAVWRTGRVTGLGKMGCGQVSCFSFFSILLFFSFSVLCFEFLLIAFKSILQGFKFGFF
jgi:hypothetical protein